MQLWHMAIVLLGKYFLWNLSNLVPLPCLNLVCGETSHLSFSWTNIFKGVETSTASSTRESGKLPADTDEPTAVWFLSGLFVCEYTLSAFTQQSSEVRSYLPRQVRLTYRVSQNGTKAKPATSSVRCTSCCILGCHLHQYFMMYMSLWTTVL